jgi:hypothetical protein
MPYPVAAVRCQSPSQKTVHDFVHHGACSGHLKRKDEGFKQRWHPIAAVRCQSPSQKTVLGREEFIEELVDVRLGGSPPFDD